MGSTEITKLGKEGRRGGEGGGWVKIRRKTNEKQEKLEENQYKRKSNNT